MKAPTTPVRVTLRIPGKWANPQELLKSLPTDCRITAEGLTLSDETLFELSALKADTQFAEIFRSCCRQQPTKDELATVDSYIVNICVSGPGGSLASAEKMMQAGAALIRAGGAGVFIDNSAMAHGGQHWLEMTEDGGSDALSFAFVAMVCSKDEVYTMGMHVLGFPEVVMKLADSKEDGTDISDIIRYLAGGEKLVGDGHIIVDLDGPSFRVLAQEGSSAPPGSPLHNPFGRFRLVNMRDIAQSN